MNSNEVIYDFSHEGLWNDIFLYSNESTKKYLVDKGARYSGKSRNRGQNFIVSSYKMRNSTFMVVRADYTSIRKSVYAELENVIHDWGLTDDWLLPQGPKAAPHLLNKVTNTQIIFAGANNYDSLKGVSKVSYLWIEEADELKEEQFDTLIPSIRSNFIGQQTPRIALTFNPPSITHWLYTKFFAEDSIIPKHKTHITETTFKDNKFPNSQLERDEINSMLESFKLNNPLYYKRYCLGEWLDYDEAKVFQNVQFRGIPQGLVPIRYGFDYGYQNDPSVLVAIYNDVEQNIIYVQELMRVKKTNSNQMADIFDELQISKVIPMSCDHNNECIDIFKSRGYNASKATNKNIEEGIARMLEYNLIVNEQNVDLVNEFNNYIYKDNGKPIDDFNHGIDALRYAIMDAFGVKAKEQMVPIRKKVRILPQY